MAENKQINDREYAGPSKTIEILGKGNAYGWIGSVIGLICGAVVGTVSTRQPGEWSETATATLKKIGIKLDGKWAIVGASALIGMQAIHFVGFAVGLRSGAKNAGAGQEQFDRLSARNAELSRQLHDKQDECTRTHLKLGENSKVKPVEPKPEIEPRGSYADALANAPAAAENLTR